MHSTRQPLQSRKAIRIDCGQRNEFDDRVIEEVPIAMLYNGVSHAVMMATPADLEDFAFGYSLSEGIVESVGELQFVEAVKSELGLSLEMIIPQPRFELLAQRRRLVSGAGCGLCGVESLEAAMRPAPKIDSRQTVEARDIIIGIRMLAEKQPMNDQSGGVHAAGFMHAEGILVREDVGRHNALDKLVGAMARQSPGDGFLVLSSRASYELIHKAAMAGIAVVATISAPSTMAIELAEASGITLVGFARGEQMNIYTHPERLL